MSAPKNPVVVSGAFDDVKSRDLRFLQEAAKAGPLTVLLWSDDSVRAQHGKPPKFPEKERLYFLRAVRYVNEVRLISDVQENAPPDIAGFTPKAWIVAAGGDNPAKKAFCAAREMEYRVLRDEVLAGFPEMSLERSAPGRKKVIVTGCYDYFHSGHVRFFEQAAGYGDLYVVVGHDDNVRLLKGAGRPLFPANERRYVAGSIRFVKQCLVSTGKGWLDAEPEIQAIKPDIYLVNHDGDVPEKRDYCAKHGLEYVVLQRTPAPGLPKRSSTDLRGF